MPAGWWPVGASRWAPVGTVGAAQRASGADVGGWWRKWERWNSVNSVNHRNGDEKVKGKRSDIIWRAYGFTRHVFSFLFDLG